MSETRKALLFKNYRKDGDPIPVIWHCFGQSSDAESSAILAVVEDESGNVIEVDADRIRFIV